MALLSLMRKLIELYSTANDPQPQMIPRPQMIPCTVLFTLFSRMQAVVLSSEPMLQIVQVNGKKEERLGQREEKGLLCFLLSGSTLISSPLPSVHILPCLKQKKNKRLLAVYKVT